MAATVVYRFGPFELDQASGRLFRGREHIPLSAAQCAILLQLLANPGDVISRDALIKAAWGNTAINENSLGQAIRRLRRAIGCGRNGTLYIQTRPGDGYRFVAAVECIPRTEEDSLAASLAAQLAPYRAFLQGQAGIDSLDAGEIRRACGIFEEIVRASPDYAEAHVAAATACGLAFAATSVTAQPDTSILQRGVHYARYACALAPSSGAAWSALAFVMDLKEARDEAAAAACRAARLEQEDTRDALRLAYVSWGDGRLRLAGRLLTLNPGLALAHWLRATVFIARGAMPAAVAEIRLGCAAQDTQPRGSGYAAVGLHLLDGLVHAAHGRLDESIEALTGELAFADSGQLYARECAANTWYAIGAVRLRQLRPADATEAFARALEIAPYHVSATAAARGEVPSTASRIDAAVGAAIILTRAGRDADAASVYREAVMNEPPGPAGWLLPVEPILNPLARPEIWSETLALIRVRAT